MTTLLFFKLWLFYAYSMTAFFIWATIKKQMEWVDFAWVINFALIIFFLLGNKSQLNQVQTAIAGMIIFWSLRLALFLYATRIRPKQVDGRYTALAARYGKYKNIKILRRKEIKIPKKDHKLSEFIGIMLGDGSISKNIIK
jgi:steroid 5-alpha reductase family enzyme